MITLRQVGIENAETLWKMQVEAFSELLEKYKDFDTSPAAEKLEKRRATAIYMRSWATALTARPE